jgi:hypothetical protein
MEWWKIEHRKSSIEDGGLKMVRRGNLAGKPHLGPQWQFQRRRRAYADQDHRRARYSQRASAAAVEIYRSELLKQELAELGKK